MWPGLAQGRQRPRSCVLGQKHRMRDTPLRTAAAKRRLRARPDFGGTTKPRKILFRLYSSSAELARRNSRTPG